MNIEEIKATIALTAGIVLVKLDLYRQEDPVTKLKTEWHSAWDDDKRVRIVMHSDVLKVITDSNKQFNELAFKKEVVMPEGEDKEEYTRYVIITPKGQSASL